jgi:hypothetical protein
MTGLGDSKSRLANHVSGLERYAAIATIRFISSSVRRRFIVTEASPNATWGKHGSISAFAHLT